MSKLGAHVQPTGPRNGYADFCRAKPAVCVLRATDPTETKTLSGGHTVTIFRHDVYQDAPEGIESTNPQGAIQLARNLYPLLEDQWKLNPADFYIVLNEPGAHNVQIIPNYVAYSMEFMRLAEMHNRKLCVLNLATGTPDDGRVAGGPSNGGIEYWKSVYGPVIRRAQAGGHVYGRHAYGRLEDPSSERPFQEEQWLIDQGVAVGIFLTELGTGDGTTFPGVEEFVQRAIAYDLKLKESKLIGGAAEWTLGNWLEANWQAALPRITAHLQANPSPPWEYPTLEPTNPDRTWQQAAWDLSIEKQTISLNPKAALQAAMARDGFNVVQSEFRYQHEGDVLKAFQAAEDITGLRPRRLYWCKVPEWNKVSWFNAPDGSPDPSPPPVPHPGIDMIRYFRPREGQNYADILILSNNWTGDERVQLQWLDGKSYIVKNRNFERRWFGPGAIYLQIDTSPEPGKYYTIQSNDGWMPLTWKPGDVHHHAEIISFFFKSNCQPAASPYTQVSEKRFIAYHTTWVSEGGVRLSDVIEVQWVKDNIVEETFFFAPYLGLVAWHNRHGRRSWVSEVIQRGTQEDNDPERGCFR